MNGSTTSQPLKIAAVSEQLDLGGSTTFLINLGVALKKRGVSFTVYNISPKHPLAASFEHAGVPFAPVPRAGIFEDRITHTLRHLFEQKPDIVIASLGTLALECLRYIPREVQRFAVAHTHEPIIYETIKPYTHLLNGLIVVSPEMLRHVESDHSLSKIPLHCIPYGVEIPDKEMPPRPLDPTNPKILYIGRLDRGQKRVQLFPQIWDTLVKGLPTCHWTIAGSGPEEAFLKNHMRQDPHHTVTFTGSVPYDQTGNLMEQHDVYLLASGLEGLPLSLLEAMGRGMVPVVSDLASGIRECVTPECGIKIAPSATDEYARAIISLYQHPEKMRAMSAASVAQARRNYSRALMAEKWMNLFAESSASATWSAPAGIYPLHSQPNRTWLSPRLRPLRRMAYRITNLYASQHD